MLSGGEILGRSKKALKNSGVPNYYWRVYDNKVSFLTGGETVQILLRALVKQGILLKPN